MKFKNVVTLTALFSFFSLILSAAIATLFSLWETLLILHVSLSILFGLCYIIQTTLEIRKDNANNRITGKKREWLTVNSYTALLLTGWVILGALLHWPPFSFFQSSEHAGPTEEQIQQSVVENDPEIQVNEDKPALPEKPPMFYSGRSMRRLSGKYDMDINRIIVGLEKIGIEASPDWTFKEIAEHNDMNSESVYEAVLQVQQTASASDGK
ncbi:hypothetical protein [Pontiella agarivorans]|uniref:Uncharacterized protein n=1 Tax=Pontiella agarivorans TaxID=3038953 RepID=A0ABU5MYE5_9BACT|nr:hypothetical protein [Pontiella agarivorans]MDZ8119203.1 hypothetical protein [Pontiella agarivorans]